MKNRWMLIAASAVAGVMVFANAAAQTQSTTTTQTTQTTQTNPPTTTTTTTQTTQTTIPVVTEENRLSVDDQIFLMNLIHANAMEIELSRIAYRQAGSHGVSNFAKMMIDDHRQLQHQLLDTYGHHHWMYHWHSTVYEAGSPSMEGMYEVSGSPDYGNNDEGHPWSNWNFIYTSDWDGITQLSRLTGYAFDQQYANDMVIGHYDLMNKINEEAVETRNSDMKALLGNITPIIQNHLEQARRVSFNYDDPFNIQKTTPPLIH